MAGRFSGPRLSSLTAAVRKGSSPSSSSIFGELVVQSIVTVHPKGE